MWHGEDTSIGTYDDTELGAVYMVIVPPSKSIWDERSNNERSNNKQVMIVTLTYDINAYIY